LFSEDTKEMESILSLKYSQKIIVTAESISRFLDFAQSAVKPLSKEEVLWHGTSPQGITLSEETLNLNRLKSSYLKSRINV